MKRCVVFAALLAAALSVLESSAQDDQPDAAGTTLELQFEGVRGSEGNLVVAVYDDPGAFERNDEALAWVAVPAIVKSVRLTEFPVSAVAVTAFHDANRNGEFDFNGTTPLEGWGTSAEGSKWSEPTFQQALARGGVIRVFVHYYN